MSLDWVSLVQITWFGFFCWHICLYFGQRNLGHLQNNMSLDVFEKKNLYTGMTLPTYSFVNKLFNYISCILWYDHKLSLGFFCMISFLISWKCFL
jgi:hypothetical protein